jgi:hypothetical protein
MLLVLAVLGLQSFTWKSLAQETPLTAEKCAGDLESLEIHKQTLEKINRSLDSLLGSGSNYETPLEIIFQSDISDKNEITKQKSELSKLVDEQAISNLPEYKVYRACTNHAVPKLLSLTIDLQKRINKKKLEFLSLDDKKRASLSQSYIPKLNKGAHENIEIKLAQSREALATAKGNLQKQESDSTPQPLGRATLESKIVDIESEYLNFVERIKVSQDKVAQLQNETRQLSVIVPSISESDFNQFYERTTDAWQSAVDILLSVFSDFEPDSAVLLLPEDATSELSHEKESAEANLAAFNQAVARQQELILDRGKILDQLKVQNFRLLQDLGSLRTKLLDLCETFKCKGPWQVNERNIGILEREVRIVPLRFVAGTLGIWLEVKSKWRVGFDGWLDLSKQLFTLLILLLVPFFLSRIFRWISYQLEQFRSNLLSKSIIDYRNRTGMTFWISRLNPFIPSTGMILSLYLARILISSTELVALGHILFYIQFYFVYRFARLIVKLSLEVLFSSTSSGLRSSESTKVSQSANRISRFIFIEYFLLYLIEDTVRRALAYHLFSAVILWVNIFLVFYEVSNWKEEIRLSFISRLPKIWKRIERYALSRFGILLFPFLFLAVTATDIIRFSYSYLSQLDLGKRLLSEILKKRLEGIEKSTIEKRSPPAEYLALFDYYKAPSEEVYVTPQASVADETIKIISSWHSGSSSNDLIIIVGNRGLGKSSAIAKIAQGADSFSKSVLSRVPARTLNNYDLFAWISNLVGTEISSVADFEKFDQGLQEKFVFCIDDIQNLFLSTIGGLAAYRTFLEIISLRTKNVFWSLTINSRSWTLLKGVFGEEHFYGKVLKIGHWRDYEIKELILSRHRLSKFELHFDVSDKAYGAVGSLGDAAEAQFFRLLWGQSRGNPRSALMYWISALSCTENNRITVGIPSFVSSNMVATMSDDALFLLAAITKHESLTQNELRLITNVEDTVIRKCLKEAEDKQLIWQDEFSRIRISSRAQYIVDYFLIGKNFLYE